jgi:D-specific alpha-keto acid dehydrogenase
VSHPVPVPAASHPFDELAGSARGRAAPSTSESVGITFYGCEQNEAVLVREVTARHDVAPTVTADAASETTVGLSAGNRCISVGHKSHISPATLLAFRRAGVRYISTRSTGRNHIDLSAAKELGISVENVVYSPASVADYTLMLILMVVRNAKATLLRSQVCDYRLHRSPGRELRDMTIGVVGAGRIGTAVIERLQGFGGRVLAYDPRPEQSRDCASLDGLLRQSDVVTLHTPLTSETHHLLHRRRIEQMKMGSFVINTGRGSLLDTEALLHGLETGQLGGAALDVLEGEEGTFYADQSRRVAANPFLLRLQRLPNVVVTPHTAYYTDHALQDMIETTVINCLGFLRGSRNE